MTSDWSQEQLVEAAGVTLNYIGNLERGEQGPSLHILVRLVLAFEIDVPALSATFSAARSGSSAGVARRLYCRIAGPGVKYSSTEYGEPLVLRSPMRQRWEIGRKKTSRGVATYRLNVPRIDVDALRLTLLSPTFPNADALGYVDCAAPRRPEVWTFRSDTEGVTDGSRGCGRLTDPACSQNTAPPERLYPTMSP